MTRSGSWSSKRDVRKWPAVCLAVGDRYHRLRRFRSPNKGGVGLILDIEQAGLSAQRFLHEEAGPGGMTLAVVEGEHAQVGTVLYFPYQSVDYHRSGDFRGMAIGTGYVCVDGETGKCRMLGAIESAELDLSGPVRPRWRCCLCSPVSVMPGRTAPSRCWSLLDSCVWAFTDRFLGASAPGAPAGAQARCLQGRR